MDQHKYLDRKHNTSINIESDGCALEDWAKMFGTVPFARHPDGFAIFIPPEAIDESDQYKDDDPYGVERNIEGAFHSRRIDCTLELIGQAVRSTGDASRILDIGCGEGHITARIKAQYPDAELSAFDYSVSAIRYAAKHFTDCEFIVCDAYEPPYASGYFDIVVCNNIWEHVPDPLNLLRTIRRVLKSSGFAIISTPSRYRLGNLARAIIGKPVRFVSEHHVTEYSVGQVIEQLKYGGFDIIECYSRREPRFGPLARITDYLFSAVISLTGSHHLLETTIFYLARKREMQS